MGETPTVARSKTRTSVCFFCQRRFAGPLTKEHVFGKWLLQRAKIMDAKITFPNGSTTRYRNVQVPACATCNSQFGSKLENRVRGIFDNFRKHKKSLANNRLSVQMVYGADDSAAATLCTWLQKVYFGMLWFETQIPLKPRRSRTDVQKTTAFRLMRRSIKQGVGFHLVGTLIVFELPNDTPIEFDFFDSLPPMPMTIGVCVDNKLIFHAIADGQLTSGFLNGAGLRRLRRDVLAHRFGTVSHYMAYCWPLATRCHLPVSPKFVWSKDQVMNMSFSGLGPQPQIDQNAVSETATALFKDLCDRRGIPFIAKVN